MNTKGGRVPFKSAQQRRMARFSAVQALYQIDMSGCSAEEVISEYEIYRFGEGIDRNIDLKVDLKWFSTLVQGVVEHQKLIDSLISSCLQEKWVLSRLDLIVCAILRAGSFEIIGCSSVPVGVLISEYVEVAHTFFAQDEPKFINAVLSSLSQKPEVKREDFSSL
ncbi:transcription antitermination factor NusB [Candidatus Liberibacter sp.]|uniref:transcription antitermination factor NusB n=1 Tax=Candidatus Liberibacter sp. TaxID=34022 RepID=UPI0015F72FF4|nr:transcription antitermination factor NusB [Candidatus Liberibacter sp.]MBA5723593.1 transcription antitermination factor NusB [Candidatus Liberibacter sp.]